MHHNCYTLHGRPSIVDRVLQQSSIDSQLFVQNRDLCLPHLHSTPPLGGSPSEYCRDVSRLVRKTRIVWLPEGETILKISLSFWQNPRTWRTDGRTDKQTPHDGTGRACIASRGNKWRPTATKTVDQRPRSWCRRGKLNDNSRYLNLIHVLTNAAQYCWLDATIYICFSTYAWGSHLASETSNVSSFDEVSWITVNVYWTTSEKCFERKTRTALGRAHLPPTKVVILRIGVLFWSCLICCVCVCVCVCVWNTWVIN